MNKEFSSNKLLTTLSRLPKTIDCYQDLETASSIIDELDEEVDFERMIDEGANDKKQLDKLLKKLKLFGTVNCFSVEVVLGILKDCGSILSERTLDEIVKYMKFQEKISMKMIQFFEMVDKKN